ncbi:MAG: hypothetical protein JRI91_04895 [Deltaproteobacteria bacterium]|nr:hypothetical protein [Deltaproteobacteria bacterium]
MEKQAQGKISFDFTIGNLLESPCRKCEASAMLPACSESCDIISKIQTALAGKVSSTLNFSMCETYTVSSLK